MIPPIGQYFEDLHPGAMWMHDCCVVTIPKMTEVNPQVSQKIMRSSPIGLILDVPDTPYENKGGKVYPLNPVIHNIPNEIGHRTYAIILNGGMYPEANYLAAWNSCSYVYRTLVQGYGVPKDHIYPLMSDGDDPAADTHDLANKILISQNLDLDGDGVPEIKDAATKANINAVFSLLNNKMQPGDQLFFFGMDHGGRGKDCVGDSTIISYLCLWKPSSINFWLNSDITKSKKEHIFTEVELMEKLQPLINKGVICNGIFGQCHSGGFVNKMIEAGCVAGSACRPEESSYLSEDKNYAEFLYHWCKALNADSKSGTSGNIRLVGDADGDGICSMEEAFDYAKNNDCYYYEYDEDWTGGGRETPQYASYPACLGQQLGFNYIVPDKDVYIKDSQYDYGNETYYIDRDVWRSPSIRCGTGEGLYELGEDPYIYEAGQQLNVTVRVHNRGWQTYTEGKKVKLYWFLSNLGMDASGLASNARWGEENPSHSLIGEQTLPNITAGGYTDLNFGWTKPNNNPSGIGVDTNNHHIGFYAVIEPTVADPTLSEVLRHNKSALKMDSYVTSDEMNKWSEVYLTNPTDHPRTVSLTFVPDRLSGSNSIFDDAQIEVDMEGSSLGSVIEDGGTGSEIGEISPNPGSLMLTSDNCILTGIELQPGETRALRLKFIFPRIPMIARHYTHNLCMSDEDNNILGGHTFRIKSPSLVSGGDDPIIIAPIDTVVGNGMNTISLCIQNNTYTPHSWTDNEGNLLGTSSILTIPEPNVEKTIRVTAYDENGEWGESEYVVEPSAGISSVTYSESDGRLTVRLKPDVTDGDRISVVHTGDGSIAGDEILSSGTTEISMNIDASKKGIYSVSYQRGSAVWDSKKIMVK